MLKFVIPLLLASTIVAYAGDDPLKLHHHFDPLVNSWDGSLQTTVSQLKAVEVPKMGGKCSTDDLKSVSSYLHSVGYTALIVSNDKSRDNVRDEIMYNINDNSVLSLSLFFEKPIKDGGDANKMVKLCTEFQGNDAYADGAAFKKLVLGQKMAEENMALNERDQYMRDRADPTSDVAKKNDGETEPYQGDPSRITYHE